MVAQGERKQKEEVSFRVEGEPHGKERARFSRVTGRSYTPKKTVEYEGRVAEAWRVQSGVRLPEGVPLVMRVECFMEMPKSWSKRRREASAGAGHIVKPDASNILKSIEDGLNGLAYKDDSAIVIAAISKRYTLGEGYCTVRVNVLEDCNEQDAEKTGGEAGQA